MQEVTFNIWAILVSGVISMVVGAIYYGPLFGKLWMKLTGITEEDAKKAPPTNYLFAFIAYIVLAVIISVLLDFAGATKCLQGLCISVQVWLAFAVILLPVYLYEMKSKALYLINIGYPLVVLIIIGPMLTKWV